MVAKKTQKIVKRSMDGLVVAQVDQEETTQSIPIEIKTRVGMTQQIAAKEIAMEHAGPDFILGEVVHVFCSYTSAGEWIPSGAERIQILHHAYASGSS